MLARLFVGFFNSKKMIEVWKDVLGFEGLYQISNFGNVKSLERYVFIPAYGGQFRHLDEIILSKMVGSMGYYKVVLCNGSKSKQVNIHRLIAIAFIPNPNNYPQVNHMDGDKQNNSINNLEWCTSKHNIRHSWAIGLSKAYWKDKGGEGNPLNIKVYQYDLNNNLIAEFYSFKEASIKTNVPRSSISRCVSGHIKHANNFIWARK